MSPPVLPRHERSRRRRETQPPLPAQITPGTARTTDVDASLRSAAESETQHRVGDPGWQDPGPVCRGSCNGFSYPDVAPRTRSDHRFLPGMMRQPGAQSIAPDAGPKRARRALLEGEVPGAGFRVQPH